MSDNAAIVIIWSIFAAIVFASLAIWLAFYGTLAYVIWHFLQKIW